MADDDGNVHVPAAVRARIAEGQRLFDAQAKGELPAVSTEPAQTLPTSNAEPEADEPVRQVATERLPTTPQTHEELPEEDVAALRRQLQQSEQRNRTLQGRMRVEVAQRDASITELRGSVQQLTSQIAELTARVLSGQSSNSSAENKYLTTPGRVASITDDERKDYGEPFFDMIGRVAQEVADRRIAEQVSGLNSKYDALGTRVDQTQNRLQLSKDERRNQWLDANVTSWREIDADPGFLDWLQQEDVGSGFPRVEILRRAMDSENFGRIKLIFEGYAQELGVIAPLKPPRQSNARARLEAQAMPNGGNGRVDAIDPGTPEAPPTPAEIADYFHRKIHHPKSLTEAEITRFEGRMRSALAAGTIRGQPRI